MSGTQGRTDEEGVDSIEVVGVCYKPWHGGPLRTVAVKRSPGGIFKCPWCPLRDADAVKMQVSRRAVHRWLKSKQSLQEHLPECMGDMVERVGEEGLAAFEASARR